MTTGKAAVISGILFSVAGLVFGIFGIFGISGIAPIARRPVRPRGGHIRIDRMAREMTAHYFSLKQAGERLHVKNAAAYSLTAPDVMIDSIRVQLSGTVFPAHVRVLGDHLRLVDVAGGSR